MIAATGEALLVIDVQRDFCPGGALAVPNGDDVVPPLNRAIERCLETDTPVYATRDWHPAVTRHFQAHGGPWPTHCVAGTTGAEFHPELQLPPDTMIVSKGQSQTTDGYSAFEGTMASGEALPEHLRKKGVRRLLVGGLATDYCVRQTVLDALREGFQVRVATDAVAGVDLEPDASTRALEEMRAAGAEIARSL